jgi:hypothetical protein
MSTSRRIEVKPGSASTSSSQPWDRSEHLGGGGRRGDHAQRAVQHERGAAGLAEGE